MHQAVNIVRAPATEAGASPSIRVSPEGRCARDRTWKRWRWIAQIAITVFALTFVLGSIQWHNSAILADGAAARIIADHGEFIRVRRTDLANAPVESIPRSDVRTFRRGFVGLIAQFQWQHALLFLFVSFASILLLSYRWKIVLQLSGRSVNITWYVLALAKTQVLAATPLSQLGADLYRMEYSAQLLRSRAEAIGVITAERVVGLIGLAVVVALGFQVSRLHSFAQIRGLALVLVAIVVLIAFTLPRLRRMQLPSSRWPKSMKRAVGFVAKVMRPVMNLIRNPVSAIQALCLSIGIHLAAPCLFLIVDRGLGLDTPGWCYCVAIPAITLAQYLPIHIAGIGILEGGLWLFLSRWSTRTADDVLAIALTARCMGLIGLLCLLPAWFLPARPLCRATARRELECPADGTLITDASLPSC